MNNRRRKKFQMKKSYKSYKDHLVCFSNLSLLKNKLTRMTTFIKMKFKKSDDHTNIDKYRVAANITKYHIISKLILLRIIIPKFMKIRQLFHVNISKSTCLIWIYRLFGHNYRVTTLSTVYLNVWGIIIPSLK